MAGLKKACYCFAYTIDSKQGSYVLNITNATAILIRDEMTGDFCDRCSQMPSHHSQPSLLGNKHHHPHQRW